MGRKGQNSFYQRGTRKIKKLLIISHNFAPSGGGGVQRTVKFVKYLTNFGWEPIVLTVYGEYFHVIDEDMVKDVPKDIKIYRTRKKESNLI